MRHSTAHVLAQALRHLYGKDVQYTIGPVIENGFFYDFELPPGFSADALPKVEAEMQKIIESNLPFSREDVDPNKAKEILHSENQRFKDEIIDELAKAGETSVSIYRQGDFTDLCRGPHVPTTGKIKSFKLMSVAGAYWRGDSNREQLTRIYGTAFFDKKELDKHLQVLEEAKKRDHRVIGKQLSLFTISPLVGSGLILWMPKAPPFATSSKSSSARNWPSAATSRSTPPTSATSNSTNAAATIPTTRKASSPQSTCASAPRLAAGKSPTRTLNLTWKSFCLSP